MLLDLKRFSDEALEFSTDENISGMIWEEFDIKCKTTLHMYVASFYKSKTSIEQHLKWFGSSGLREICDSKVLTFWCFLSHSY